MKRYLIMSTALFATTTALAYKPAVEKEFKEIASQGCSDRAGDFIVRGMVSSANETTVVLSDPQDPRITMSLTLPGRGPLARAKGVFGKSKYEASDQRLNELRTAGMPVVVTLKCKGNGAPVARNISYRNADGSHSSISF